MTIRKNLVLACAWIVTSSLAAGACAPKSSTATPSSASPAATPKTVPAPPILAAAPSQAGQAAASTINEPSIRAHMEFLASDALNGRASGSRDERIAATYVGAQFRLWGLDPMGDAGGFVQQIEMVGAQAAAPPVLRIGSNAYTHGKELLVTALGSLSASGPIVKYRSGAEIPAGSIVLLPEGATPGAVPGAGVVLLMEVPQVRSQWATRGGTMPSLPARAVKVSAPATPRPSVIFLDKGTYTVIAASPDGTTATFSADAKPTAPTYTWNAVARLTGSDPVLSKQTIVLSAHLDHIGARPVAAGADGINNGADDDASGTVAVMMLAEALAKGPRPKRTVVFALFGSEETGGHGAGYFVDLPVVPLAEIVADLQFEMIGRADPMVPDKTLWLTGYERSNLGATLAKQGARLVADPHPEQSFFTRSDNIRFARRGVIAHTVSSYNLHKEYHQPSDDISKIDFAHMTESIRSLLTPIRWLADSTFKPDWAAGGCPAPCK